MADDDIAGMTDTADMLDTLTLRTRELEVSANSFARAMTKAFSGSVAGGKQFDDVLKSLALRLSDLTLRMAFKPLEHSLASGINSLFSRLFAGGTPSLTAATGAIKPFASGGVIGTPTYFPLIGGSVGLAGEAGPEAIVPLARGPDGRLGVRGGDGAAATVNVTIATPDAESFRRSESFVAGQIARAVARGRRSL